MKHKLSASALNTFLRSPRAYYWNYIARLQPLQQSTQTYDHDKLFGILWAEFVDNFYKHVPEATNTQKILLKWHASTDGWVPDKQRLPKTKALEALTSQYYQQFDPNDGVRNGSELFRENERFLGYLDGLSHEGIVHECKTTSRSPQIGEQLWKVQNSVQVKLYCVLADAKGHCIEFAFKDAPYQIFRGPVVEVSTQQKKEWEQQLNSLADYIYSLGDDINNYVCHSDGCNLITRNIVAPCQFQTLCDMGLTTETSIAFKPKEHRK